MVSGASGKDVSLPELVELLRLCISRVEVAVPEMRASFYNPTDRYAVALLLAVTDYARCNVALAGAKSFSAIPGVTRSALDAYADIANLCDHSAYWKHLEAADSSSWNLVLQAASRGDNPFLKGVSESEYLLDGRAYYGKRQRSLESVGVKKLQIKERFQKAGLRHEYESAYSLLSAEAHNNVSSLVSRYFDISDDAIEIRKSDRGNLRSHHYELPCTLMMSEILLRSTEKVLQHCGHGIAVLSEANSRFYAVAAIVSGIEQQPDSNLR